MLVVLSIQCLQTLAQDLDDGIRQVLQIGRYHLFHGLIVQINLTCTSFLYNFSTWQRNYRGNTLANRYQGQKNFTHGRPARMGVVLVNLGTPQAANAKALRHYLAEFLSDPRVVEIPRLAWLFILHAIILRTRPKRSARTYAKIWTEQGSPLMANSEMLTTQVAEELMQRLPGPANVVLAMRYGEPSVKAVLKDLQEQGAENSGRSYVSPVFRCHDSFGCRCGLQDPDELAMGA